MANQTETSEARTEIDARFELADLVALANIPDGGPIIEMLRPPPEPGANSLLAALAERAMVDASEQSEGDAQYETVLEILGMVADVAECRPFDPYGLQDEARWAAIQKWALGSRCPYWVKSHAVRSNWSTAGVPSDLWVRVLRTLALEDDCPHVDWLREMSSQPEMVPTNFCQVGVVYQDADVLVPTGTLRDDGTMRYEQSHILAGRYATDEDTDDLTVWFDDGKSGWKPSWMSVEAVRVAVREERYAGLFAAQIVAVLSLIPVRLLGVGSGSGGGWLARMGVLLTVGVLTFLWVRRHTDVWRHMWDKVTPQ